MLTADGGRLLFARGRKIPCGHSMFISMVSTYFYSIFAALTIIYGSWRHNWATTGMS